eukprot:Hpha_TRINITY_DN16297_c3_g5::TRINITY_DN16297_c3_g5_i1::g.15721::m.15721
MSMPGQSRPQGDLKQLTTRCFNRATPSDVQEIGDKLCSAVTEASLREQYEAAESLAAACSNMKMDCPLAGVSAELYSRMSAASWNHRLFVVSLLTLRRKVGHAADDRILPYVGNFSIFFGRRLLLILDAAVTAGSNVPNNQVGVRAMHHLGQLCVRGLVDPHLVVDRLLEVARRDPIDCSLDAQILASGLQTVGHFIHHHSRTDAELAHLSASLIEAIRAKSQVIGGRPRFLLGELVHMAQDGWPSRTVIPLHAVMTTPCNHRTKKGNKCGQPSVGRGRHPMLCKLHQPQFAPADRA